MARRWRVTRSRPTAEISLDFRARNWLRVPSACPPGMDKALAAIDDLEPYVAGSFDDVVLAYDLAHLPDRDYDTLVATAATTIP
jgi:hypothetical protein